MFADGASLLKEFDSDVEDDDLDSDEDVSDVAEKRYWLVEYFSDMCIQLKYFLIHSILPTDIQEYWR
uniref:PiggyBac transposable element-derived protein domain-containing protein n=1 Tax=Ascaris lumbricoides TaxID=6252 RepID=A0A9J2Q327_ASCLU